eukprot:GEMP01026559.1.p1 GENE.GEMP01026559.1~~GEMP01026559.1.p1  ORF type:complete len:611 (+),score=81.48 GEMP01026559.1:70-1902(+)
MGRHDVAIVYSILLCGTARGQEQRNCDIPVQVLVHFTPKTTPIKEACNVRFVDQSEIKAGLHPENITGYDVYFTNDFGVVPYHGRINNWYQIDFVDAWAPAENLDDIIANKTHLVSAIFPLDVLVRENARWMIKLAAEMEAELGPEHIFMDDRTEETYEKAFKRYRFSIIVDPEINRTSLAYIRSLAYQTVPLFNGFFDYGGLFSLLTAGFGEWSSFASTLENIRDLNNRIGSLWAFARLQLDSLAYRYPTDFPERILRHSCVACTLHRTWEKRQSTESIPPTSMDANAKEYGRSSEAAQDKAKNVEGAPVEVANESDEQPLVYVGIYSAMRNAHLRQTIRETWGKVIVDMGFRYDFYLNTASAAERAEATKYGDIIVLDALEGYRHNARKGILFHRSVSMNSNALFLLKLDDDIYLRPYPLIAQLKRKPPFSYVWGFFDLSSPTPDDPDDNFYNPPELYPFNVFPPYTRGCARVTSMDVIRKIADMDRAGKLRNIFGDDPNFGVHLRYVTMDEHPLALYLDDFDSYKRFAMNPECKPEASEEPPPESYDPHLGTPKPKYFATIRSLSWVVHHVNPSQIRCMWNIDVEELRGNWSSVELPSLCACSELKA